MNGRTDEVKLEVSVSVVNNMQIRDVFDYPAPKKATGLLVNIGMHEPAARRLASRYSFRRIFDVLAYAHRYRNGGNPAGLVRKALEERWNIPCSFNRQETIALTRKWARELEAYLQEHHRHNVSELRRHHGEAEGPWLRRVMELSIGRQRSSATRGASSA